MLNIFVYIQQFIGICFQEDNTETVPEVPQEEEAVEETPCEVSYLMSDVCLSVCLRVCLFVRERGPLLSGKTWITWWSYRKSVSIWYCVQFIPFSAKFNTFPQFTSVSLECGVVVFANLFKIPDSIPCVCHLVLNPSDLCFCVRCVCVCVCVCVLG